MPAGWPADPTRYSMSVEELAGMLGAMGCPAVECGEMAAQLDRRARQLSEVKGRSYEEALRHLLGLMRQGWSARERGH